jgi:hypothetical protein
MAPSPAAALAPVRRRGTDLLQIWIVSLLASAGITAAGLVGDVPELMLGSVVFIGLAIVRTVQTLRRPA